MHKTPPFPKALKIWSPAGSGVPRIPTDRGAWWATVHRVAESQTRLKRPSSHTSGGIDEDQLRYFSHGWLRGRGQTAPESEPRASGLFPCYLVTTRGPRKQSKKYRKARAETHWGLGWSPTAWTRAHVLPSKGWGRARALGSDAEAEPQEAGGWAQAWPSIREASSKTTRAVLVDRTPGPGCIGSPARWFDFLSLLE